MIVDKGTETKNGPLQWPSLNKEYKKVIVWIVFPKPISSARIVSMPFAQEYRNQLRPTKDTILVFVTKQIYYYYMYLPTDIREVGLHIRQGILAVCPVFS